MREIRTNTTFSIVLALAMIFIGFSANAQNPFLPKYDAIKRSERCYTVTYELNNQFGSIWWADKIDFSQDTVFTFVVYMGDKDNNGADGLAFIMHKDPRDTISDTSQQVIIGGAGNWDLAAATGDDGGGLGYAMHTSRVGPNTIPGPHGTGDDPENHKIQPSVAVEIDTYYNGDPQDGQGSPYQGQDHTAVVYNGDIYNQQQTITDANGNTGKILPLKPSYGFSDNNIEDDNCYTFQIRWDVLADGTQDLELWIDTYDGSTNTGGLQMVMTHNDDMINNVFSGDASSVRFGFTGSTGGLNNEQTICLLGENLAPFAADDYATIPENGSEIINVEANDNDPDNDQLHVPIILKNASHGSALIFDSLDINYLRYTPDANYTGNDTISYVTCDVNSTKPYAKCDTAFVFISVQDQVIDVTNNSNFNKSYFNVEISGEDTACVNDQSDYELNIDTNDNSYFDPNFATGRVTQYNPLVFNYEGLDVQNTFSFDFWVNPSATINMKGESSVCYGSVSVPLANSGQNWAVYPGHVNPNFGVGVSVGSNGIMIAEHSGYILVSRLSHTTTINDWTHVGVVYNTDSICLYLNGNLVGTRPMHCSSNPKFAPSSIASALYSSRYQGSIDEFRLWDKALAAAEVSSLKDKKLINEVPNLRYYVSFDNSNYIRSLGDLGTDSITTGDNIGEDLIVQSTWDIEPYMGDDISALFPFTIESLDYQWSTGGVEKSNSFSPESGVNELNTQANNQYLTISDTIKVFGENCSLQTNDTRYIRFRSYYSEDNSQVNVYEIQAYKDGVNVGLNMPTFANSHEFGNNEPYVNDGNGGSRWSSDRDDLGPNTDNPHFIVVDLQQGYDLDSIILNIEGFDNWEQTFDFAISSDSVNWEIIGSGDHTTGIFTYLTTPGNSGDLQFSMNEESVATNQEILYPVTVKGFENILTAQYTISWDPTVITYLGVQDFTLRGLDEGSFHLFEPGKLTFSWNPSDLQPESVDDDTEIFNIVFEAVGQTGQETDIVFSDVPTQREVSDADGNILDATYVNGKITIIDDVILGGYIKTQKGEALTGIKVELIGGMELSTTTDQYGWYSFSVLPNKEYHIAPLFDTDADDGVSTLDIVIMHWHILGKKYMMSNHDLIASDVNQSKSLTTLDLAETRAVILHNKEKFRDRNAVELVNHEYNGDVDVFEYKNYLDIIPTQSHLNLNYTAVKIGDGGRNWKANKNNNGREQNLENIIIEIEKTQTASNKVNLQLLPKDFKNIVGLQFTLEWNPEVYQFEQLSDRQLRFATNLNLVEEGKLTVMWNSTELNGMSSDKNNVLSEIEFALLDSESDPKVSISSGLTYAIAYNSNLEPLNIVGTSRLENKLNTGEITIYPNPAEDFIKIAVPQAGVNHYSIITATGVIVSSGEIHANNDINVSHLKKGMYILQISDDSNRVINKKLMKE